VLLIEEIPNGGALRAPAVVRGPLWAGSQALRLRVSLMLG